MGRAAWLSSVSLLLVACGTAATPQPATPTKTVAPATTPATPVAQPPAPEPALGPDSVVARVDDMVITLREVDARVTHEEKVIIGQAESQHDPARAAYFLAFARVRAVEELIDIRLLLKAADREFVVVTDDELDLALLEIEKQNSLTRGQLEAALLEQGFTMETYRHDLRDQIAVLRIVKLRQDPKLPQAEARIALVQQLRKAAKIEVKLVVPNLPVTHDPQAAKATPAGPALTIPDVERALGRSLGAFEEGTLSDEPPTATYASVHFKAVGHPESFDLAVRVWRHTPKTARNELITLQSSIKDTRPIAGLATIAFKAFDKDARVFGVGFLDEPTSLVVLVTCGTDLCKSHDETLAVTKLLATRLDRLAGMLK